MKIAGSCIGIEIDVKVIRATILDSQATRIIGYAQVKRNSNSKDEYLNLANDLRSLWTKLPEKFTGNVRVAASFGAEGTGVVSGEAIDEAINAASIKIGEPMVKMQNLEVCSYAPESLITGLRMAFARNAIPLERLELAPDAAVRVIPRKSSCTFTVGSGCWWEATVVNGRLVEATQTQISSDDRSLYTLQENSTREVQFDQLTGIDFNPELLERFNVSEASLAVSVGVAMGLATSADSFRIISDSTTTIVDLEKTQDLITLDEPTLASIGASGNPVSQTSMTDTVVLGRLPGSTGLQTFDDILIVDTGNPDEASLKPRRRSSISPLKIALIVGAIIALSVMALLAGVGVYHIINETDLF